MKLQGMHTKILVVCLATLILAACSKDKFSTKPKLTLKKVNTKELALRESIQFTIEVTDSEGDLQDSIWVQEIVRNCASSGFTQAYLMPEFDAVKNLKGDIDVCYSYGPNLECPSLTHSLCVNKNDSATFRFWIRDKGANISDTISSEEIVILK